jgi:CheY-like chemotaxis protein
MSTAKHIFCLIDDDDIYQYTARFMLESTGLAKEIHSFFNGSDAIRYFRDQKNITRETLPDIIFLDINMPVMNGWEFLEEYGTFYTSFPKTIAVYVVSSSVDSSDMQKSRSYKAVNDYIVKPINRKRYLELIAELS